MFLKFKMNLIIILYLFTCTMDAYSDTFKVEIQLKNQTTLKTTISNIDTLGLTLADNQFIIYKVIQTIHTQDAAFVDELQKLVQEIKIEYTENNYTIDCSNVPVRLNKPPENEFFRQEYFMISLMSSWAENFEFQLNLVPTFCQHFIGQIAYSIGWSHLEHTNHVSAYTIGVGGQMQVSDFNYIAMINLARKVNMLSNDEAYTFAALHKNSLYASLSAQYFYPYSKYIYSFGLRYYFENIQVEDKKTTLALNIGFGITF